MAISSNNAYYTTNDIEIKSNFSRIRANVITLLGKILKLIRPKLYLIQQRLHSPSLLIHFKDNAVFLIISNNLNPNQGHGRHSLHQICTHIFPKKAQRSVTNINEKSHEQILLAVITTAYTDRPINRS